MYIYNFFNDLNKTLLLKNFTFQLFVYLPKNFLIKI